MSASPTDSIAPELRRLRALGSSVARAADLSRVTALMTGSDLSPTSYAAFISYSHRDAKVAAWLRRAIESYRIPSALIGCTSDRGTVPPHLRPVFRDEDELPGASELGPQLEAALRTSGALVVLCSPAAAASKWVDREIAFFKTTNADRPVFAVIVDGVPGSADAECFPPSLKMALIDGVLQPDPTIEPLAPDLQKQDRSVVKLKLIAGLLGVKYDDLYRRERRRSRAIISAIATLAFVVIAALSILAFAAVSYANEAIKQRNRAQVSQALAERNAQDAERRAWLAQVAAVEIRRQSDLLDAREQRRPER